MAEEVYQIVVNSSLDSPPLSGLHGIAGMSPAQQLSIRDGAVQLRVPAQMELDTEQDLPDTTTLQIQNSNGDSMAIVPIHTTKDDGTEEITYVQVGPPSVLEPGTMSVQDLMEQMNLFIQYGVNWKKDFLKDLRSVADGWCDYPVFCRDGVSWTNRLVLVSLSKMIEVAIEESDVNSCLVLPDVTREQFEKFHQALFMGTDPNQRDLLVHIKYVSHILCIETFRDIVEEGAMDTSECTVSYSVNYRDILNNNEEKIRVMRNLGFILESNSHLEDSNLNRVETKPTPLAQLFGEPKLKCELCKRKFYVEEHLVKHLKVFHSGMLEEVRISKSRSQTYACQVCGKTFGFAINVKKHVWLFHKEIGKKSGSVPSHSVQINKVPAVKKIERRKEKLEDIRCATCGVYYESWKKLQLHMLDHTSERPFKCASCSKGFKEESKLKRHMIIHTGDKPFKCKFCDKAFSLKHNMQTHERIHTGEGYECGYCGLVHQQQTNLKKHEKRHLEQRHIITDDVNIRKRQITDSVRGRPAKNGNNRFETLNRKMQRIAPKETISSSNTGQKVFQSFANFDETSAAIDNFISESQSEIDESLVNNVVDKSSIVNEIQISTD